MYENATARPWRKAGISVEAEGPTRVRSIATIYPNIAVSSSDSIKQMHADAALIVHAVNSIEALEQSNSLLTKRVEDARRALAFIDYLQGEDASLNLQGVEDDLSGRWAIKDGGVCLRTIKRVIAQLEAARTALEGGGT